MNYSARNKNKRQYSLEVGLVDYGVGNWNAQQRRSVHNEGFVGLLKQALKGEKAHGSVTKIACALWALDWT